MKNNGHDIDKIDKYLKKQLSEQERRDFEQQMENDPDLAKEVALQQDVMEGIDAYFSKGLKRNLQELEKEIRHNQTEVVRKKRRWFSWVTAIAASVLMVLLAGYFILFSKPDNQELFQAYYQPYPNIVAPAERSENGADEDTQPFRLYESGNYSAAIPAFEIALETAEEQEKPALHFYYGLSLLHLGKTAPAIEHLQLVSKQEDSPFALPAQWYQALAFLKNNDPVRAKAILEELRNSDTIYQKKSMELLEELGASD